MLLREAELNDAVLETLIALSKEWEAEQSCHSYRANARADIEGNRIFLAEADGAVIGYLFGKRCKSERQSSIMPDATPYFEVEELYVVPSRRSRGVGAALLEYAVDALGARWLWALEKNAGALCFYARHGFTQTGERTLEEGTAEYLVKLQYY